MKQIRKTPLNMTNGAVKNTADYHIEYGNDVLEKRGVMRKS